VPLHDHLIGEFEPLVKGCLITSLKSKGYATYFLS